MYDLIRTGPLDCASSENNLSEVRRGGGIILSPFPVASEIIFNSILAEFWRQSFWLEWIFSLIESYLLVDSHNSDLFMSVLSLVKYPWFDSTFPKCLVWSNFHDTYRLLYQFSLIIFLIQISYFSLIPTGHIFCLVKWNQVCSYFWVI